MVILPGTIVGLALSENGSTVLNDGSNTVTYAYRESDFAGGTTAGTIGPGSSVSLYGTVYFSAVARTSLEVTTLSRAGSVTATVVDSSSNVVASKVAGVILAADGTVDNIQVGTVNNGVFTPDAGQS